MFSTTLPAVFQHAFRPILEWRLNAVNAQILRAQEQQDREPDNEVFRDRTKLIEDLFDKKEALESKLGLA